MNIPTDFVVSAFVAILSLQAWQVSMLYRLVSRVQRLETAFELNGLKLPHVQEL